VRVDRTAEQRYADGVREVDRRGLQHINETGRKGRAVGELRFLESPPYVA